MAKAATMAKKRGPKPKPDEVRSESVTFKCRPEYKEWVVALADKHRTTPSDLIDRALVMFAAADGFEPPPRR